MFLLSCKMDVKVDAPSHSGSTADTGILTAGIRMIPINTPVGNFHVWTKKFGDNPKLKVLLLHGGPAMGHEYLECFESYFPPEGIEFYEYDQLGSSYSDVPTDSSLWTTERFVEEVEQVRQALGLDKNNFILYGHSWGGILAMEYAFKYGANLKGLIISNMMSSVPDYGKYAGVLAKEMDPAVVAGIRKMEETKQTSNPRYEELLMPNFYAKHICRLAEWPEPVNRCFRHLNKEIYTMMQGPSEFGVSGRLTNWDRKADLPKLTMPTLVIGAGHDTMDPNHMKWMSTQVKNGTYLFCPNGSHLCMWDDQRTYMKGVVEWVKKLAD
jgi:proline iminopeptidase